MPLLKSVLAPRYVWTLCRIGSPFLAMIFWPTIAVVVARVVHAVLLVDFHRLGGRLRGLLRALGDVHPGVLELAALHADGRIGHRLLRAVRIRLAVQLARRGRLAGEVDRAFDGLGHRGGRQDQGSGDGQRSPTGHLSSSSGGCWRCD